MAMMVAFEELSSGLATILPDVNTSVNTLHVLQYKKLGLCSW